MKYRMRVVELVKGEEVTHLFRDVFDFVDWLKQECYKRVVTIKDWKYVRRDA